MRRVAPTATLAAILLLSALLPASPAAAADARIEVAILEPGPFDPVSGEITVKLEVKSPEPIERIDLYVDGVLRRQLTEDPYLALVDLGTQNEEHVFHAVAYGTSGASGEMTLQTPAFEVDETIDVPLQQLYVTVTRGGDRVDDLDRERFTIIDDGQEQEIVTFEGGDAPMTAVMLVDSSESMRGERLAAAVRGARAFTAGMRELDEAMTILFADRLLAASPFTDQPAVLTASLDGIEAGGGTALTDHLFAGIKILDGRQGRRVVVVLSDGQDVYSSLSMDDVLWKIRRSQAIVYWLQLRDRHPNAEPGLYSSAWRDAEANKREFETLRTIIRESGGRVREIESIDEVEPAFRAILAELRDQYVIGYYPTDLQKDGSWREVNVDVSGFGNKVRVREGYVDF